MRVLVLSALLACASAAPSFLAPVPYGALAVAPVGIAPFAIAPTIPPGDIQAAAIDAQVKIADQARSIADQAQELAEQAVEVQNEGVIESKDLGLEKTEEAYWAAEEKQWQKLNEAQIAEARAYSAAASNDGAIAGSYSFPGVVGVASAAAGESAAAAIEAGSGSEAKAEIKSAAAEVKSETAEVKSEGAEVKSEEKAEIKAAEAEKPAEAEKKDDAIEIKAAPEALQAQLLAFPGYKPAVFPSPIGVARTLNFQPYVAPISYQASYKTYPIPAVQPFAAFPKFYQPTAIGF